MQRLGSSSAPIVFTALSIVFGCSAGTGDSTSGPNNQGGSGGSAPVGAAPSMGGSSDGGSTGQFNPQGGGTTQPGCDTTPTADKDQDGVTLADGDCNDCDPNVGPGAIEVIADGEGTGGGGGYVPVDEDCDGEADNVAPPCDGTLDMIGTDPYDGARAIELCKVAMNDVEWGLLNAQWVRANGTPATVNAQMGILPDFGPNVHPRAGGRMLGISSGTARDATDPGFMAHSWSANGPGTAPPGYPQDVPNCPVSTVINDDVALELAVRSPKNATGYHFDFKFYSNEYPEFVCTTFNDQFIALVNPAPMGANNGNISFDSGNNPVSVNIAFFDVCQGCPAGTAEMEGTDFIPDDGGTSWLQTSAPITGGDTFSIRFAIWDVGDSAWDSTTLIDNFEWVANGGTVTVGTTPVPE